MSTSSPTVLHLFILHFEPPNGLCLSAAVDNLCLLVCHLTAEAVIRKEEFRKSDPLKC